MKLLKCHFSRGKENFCSMYECGENIFLLKTGKFHLIAIVVKLQCVLAIAKRSNFFEIFGIMESLGSKECEKIIDDNNFTLSVKGCHPSTAALLPLYSAAYRHPNDSYP